MKSPLLDLDTLLASWQIALRSEAKSPLTVKAYSAGVRSFLRWCATTGTPAELTKPNVQRWIGDMLEGGAEPATAIAHQQGVRGLSRWLADDGNELDSDPLLGLRRPQMTKKVVPSLSDEELRALIEACKGRALKDRRDEAIIRLMAETGMRAGEVCGLSVADVDLARGLATVRRGKGGKGRIVPFGPKSVAALDRYLRAARREGRITEDGPLWASVGGKPTFGYDGLDGALKRRAQAAGIAKFHAHRLRHTAASRWLRAGGSEQGLMSVAGWATRSMLDRYTSDTASDRAATESRALNLGDI